MLHILRHKSRPPQLPARSLPSAQPPPQPQTSWRAITTLKHPITPGPAAELCIISDRLDRLQDANQPQIKSSSKLMSNHILSVQLHSITRELPERDGEGEGGIGAELPRALHSTSSSSWPYLCSQNLPLITPR